MSVLARVRAWFEVNGTFPLKLFLITRAGYLLASYVGMTLIPGLWYHPERRQMFLAPYPAIDGLCRWDCGWFVTIFKDGYNTAENAKVFPLLPLLGWIFDKVGVHHLITFIVVPNLCSLASYYVLYRMFRELNGEEAARWGLAASLRLPVRVLPGGGVPRVDDDARQRAGDLAGDARAAHLGRGGGGPGHHGRATSPSSPAPACWPPSSASAGSTRRSSCCTRA